MTNEGSIGIEHVDNRSSSVMMSARHNGKTAMLNERERLVKARTELELKGVIRFLPNSRQYFNTRSGQYVDEIVLLSWDDTQLYHWVNEPRVPSEAGEKRVLAHLTEMAKAVSHEHQGS